jgi:hypothetical protein
LGGCMMGGGGEGDLREGRGLNINLETRARARVYVCVACAHVLSSVSARTTTELTASLAAWVARALGAESVGGTVELAVRGVSVAPLRSIYHFTLSVARRGFFFFY